MLHDVEPYPTGVVGEPETIYVYPSGVHIASASYVTDAEPNAPSPAIAADHQSLTLNVLKGVGTLAVAVISANPTVPQYWLYQGNNPTDDPLTGGATSNNMGACDMQIEGLAP